MAPAVSPSAGTRLAFWRELEAWAPKWSRLYCCCCTGLLASITGSMAVKACSSAFMDVPPWPPETTEKLKKLGYEFIEKIGFGSFAVVYKVSMTRDGKTTTIACKAIDLKSSSARYREKFFPREVEATKTLRHRYIVHVFDVLEDKVSKFCFIFMQLAMSDLLKQIQEASGGKIDESHGRVWGRQLIEALLFLHSKHWVHRDLKVENVLIGDDNNVLLSDFGFSRQQKPEVLSSTHCGSMAYAAPELLTSHSGPKKGEYDAYKADTWSIGVCLYVMHTGSMPFDDSDPSQMRRLHEGAPRVIDAADISSSLKNLLKKFLVMNPAERITLKDALEDHWFKKHGVVAAIKNALGSLVGLPKTSPPTNRPKLHRSSASLTLSESSPRKSKKSSQEGRAQEATKNKSHADATPSSKSHTESKATTSAKSHVDAKLTSKSHVDAKTASKPHVDPKAASKTQVVSKPASSSSVATKASKNPSQGSNSSTSSSSSA